MKSFKLLLYNINFLPIDFKIMIDVNNLDLNNYFNYLFIVCNKSYN